MKLKCSFCFFSDPFVSRPAEFVIDGQAVCEDHVDTASTAEPFGRTNAKLHLENRGL